MWLLFNGDKLRKEGNWGWALALARVRIIFWPRNGLLSRAGQRIESKSSARGWICNCNSFGGKHGSRCWACASSSWTPFQFHNPFLLLLSGAEQAFGLHDNSQLSLFTCLPLPNSQLLINTSLIRYSYSESILSTFSSQFGRPKADLSQGRHIHYIPTHPLRTLPVARESDSSSQWEHIQKQKIGYGYRGILRCGRGMQTGDK
jgi:hypothetical protein